MKSELAVLIIFSFVGVAVFGFMAMGYGGYHHGGCLAAVSRGGGCPDESRTLDFALFHLGAFKGFSTAVFGKNFFTALLVLAALFLVAELIIRDGVSTASFHLNLILHRGRTGEPLTVSPRGRLVRWLALHENSPAVS